jgi:hypothetical protein
LTGRETTWRAWSYCNSCYSRKWSQIGYTSSYNGWRRTDNHSNNCCKCARLDWIVEANGQTLRIVWTTLLLDIYLRLRHAYDQNILLGVHACVACRTSCWTSVATSST